MAITRVYSVWVIGGAAVIAILPLLCNQVRCFDSDHSRPGDGGD